MAGSINKVILIGNVGKDPDIRATQGGKKLASFSLATSESWKDKSTGERKDKTEWHRVVVYNEHLVDLVEKYVRKGSKIYLEGSLQTRKWTDQAGVEKFSTEVVLQNFNGVITLLDSGGGRTNAETNTEYGFGAGEPPQKSVGGKVPEHERGFTDSEIPF